MKKVIITLSKIFVSITLFLLILNNLDFSGTVELLKNMNVNFLSLVILIFVFQIFAASIRWIIVLNGLDIRLPYRSSLRYLWIGLFFNQALPSSVGGDVLRGYYLHHNGNSLKESVAGVLLDRFFGIVGLIFLILFIVPNLLHMLDNTPAQWSTVLVSAVILILISIFLVLDILPLKFQKWNFLIGLYMMSFNARKLLFSIRPGIILILLSVIIHLLSIFAAIILSEGLEIKINWLGFFLIMPLVTIFMLIPISIAGWGVREGVMVIGLGYLNVAPEQAMALSILYGLSMLAISLPGGVIWLFSSRPSINEI